jgi:single-stranded DNA-binding protein
MMDSRNVVVLTGGIATDPEKPTENIVKFRLVVDMAGREADATGKKVSSGGFFDVVYYLNDANPNTKFVKGQLDAGNMKKGSSIVIAGRLEHDRFKTKEGQNASRVQVIAESISYAGRKPTEENGAGTPAAAAAAPAQAQAEAAPVEF